MTSKKPDPRRAAKKGARKPATKKKVVNTADTEKLTKQLRAAGVPAVASEDGQAIRVGSEGTPPINCENCGLPFQRTGEGGRRTCIYEKGKWQCDRDTCAGGVELVAESGKKVLTDRDGFEYTEPTPEQNATIEAELAKEDEQGLPPIPVPAAGRTPAPTISVPTTAPSHTTGGLAAKLAQREVERGADPHLLIEARAGTGKTTTLIEGIKHLYRLGGVHLIPSPQQDAIWKALLGSSQPPRSSLFVAFNTSIADELGRRIPKGVSCKAMTLHKFGYIQVRKAFRLADRDPGENSERVKKVICELTGSDLSYLRASRPVFLQSAVQLVEKCKMTLTGWQRGAAFPRADWNDTDWAVSLRTLTDHFDIETDHTWEEVVSLVPRALTRCMDVDKDGFVDFSDMIWLPVVHRLPVFRNDVLLVDERQDLNRCQMELCLMSGRRVVAVGDSRQSIYGFAGADPAACQTFRDLLEGTGRGVSELPLTMTRRCGRRIVAEARQLVPDFEAHPDNPEGHVGVAKYPIQTWWEGGVKHVKELPVEETYLPLVGDGDMVLCRANAPLVNQFFRFLKMGKRAFIRGRDMADNLLDLLGRMDASSPADLIRRLGDWLADRQAKENALKDPSPRKLEALQDRHDCLVQFAKEASSLSEVRGRISAIFSRDDERRPGIQLSSGHKAKGLEADRVFYIQGFGRPEEYLKDWELEQEENLRYVCITRAKSELIYVV